MGILDFLFGKERSPSKKPQPTAGFRWQKSEPHLLLLSRFLVARNPEDAAPPYWEGVLGEQPGIAVDRFIKLGLLVPSPVRSKLELTFNVVDLKPLLQARGLPVSGKKAQLIDRLLAADPEGMASIVAHLKRVECSAEARAIAEKHLETKKAEKAEAVAKSLALLRSRNFREASLAVSSYEARQVFSRGLGIDWSRHDPAADVQFVETLTKARPNILRGVIEQDWEHLWIAAAMLYLWGTSRAKEWLPAEFVGLERFDHETAIRMLKFHAGHERDMAQFRKMGIKRATVKGCGDASCEACRKITGKLMPLADIPELPYAACTHEMGCRCYVAPELASDRITDDELPAF